MVIMMQFDDVWEYHPIPYTPVVYPDASFFFPFVRPRKKATEADYSSASTVTVPRPCLKQEHSQIMYILGTT